MVHFKDMYYINVGNNYDSEEDKLNWENVSDNPMRFYYLLGWYHRHHWNVTWVISPNTVNIRGIDFHLYFYVGHVTVRGKDLVKFRMVSEKKDLSL